MAAFVSPIPAASPAQMVSLATAVNEALRGHCAVTGSVTVASGKSNVTIQDPRCRAGRLALLIPMNGAAAGVDWYLSAMTLGSMTFTFSAATGGAADFGYALIGDGTQLEQ